MSVITSVYKERGYGSREDYLASLAREYDFELDIVFSAADTLGPNEDFDGLLLILEDLV